ncbi:MAG: zinc ribbon domain-containing protein [bacterium]|nr:zinc ribbon domain-containing protein [bacterium]
MTQYINPRNYKFCPVCGSHLSYKYVTDEKTNRLVCGECGFIFYINPTPAVAVILMKENRKKRRISIFASQSCLEFTRDSMIHECMLCLSLIGARL